MSPSLVRAPRCGGRLAVLVATLLLASPAALAQSFSGSFPLPPPGESGPLSAVSTYCSSYTPRAYTTWRFQNPAAGNWTVTVTRSGGGTVYLALYQNGLITSNTCANYYEHKVGSGSASITVSSSYPSWWEIVIAGAHGTDAGTFTVSVSPSSGLVTQCGSSTLTPASQAVPAAGGSYTATYTPYTGCGAWTASGVPSWISGIPASGTGPATLSYSVATNSTGASRSAAITLGGQTLSVSQAAASCTFNLGATSANVAGAGGTSSVALTASASGCAWTGTANAPWLTLNTSSGAGSQSVSYTVAPNTGAARQGTLTIAGQFFTINQAAGCGFSLPASAGSVPATSGGHGFTVTASEPTCAWTASTSTPWISIPGGTGTGSGTVSYSVTANTGPERQGTITVGGQTYTVTQASGCAYSLPAASATPSAAGGNASFSLTANNPSCPWTAAAASGASWIGNVTAGGSGSGTVNYTVAPNTGPQRVGTITAGGQTFTVTQASGCTFSIDPMAASIAAGGANGSFTVTASNPSCTWTAGSPDSFVTNVTPAGTGSGPVSYTVLASAGAARTGTIVAAGNTFSFTQASGCTASLSPPTLSVPASGATRTVALTLSDASCPWTALPADAWIALSAGSESGTGSRTLELAVEASLQSARSTTVAVAGQSLTVNQASGCTFGLPTASASAPASGGGASFALTASGADCAWTAISGEAWLTGVTASGTGAGTLSYSVAPNSGPARTGTITAGGQTFTVTQASGCTFSIDPMGASVAAGGANGTFAVTASDPSCTWTASSPDSFVTNVTPGGTGSGSVSYTVLASSGAARTGTIVAAGNTFTVDQGDGCTASLSPPALSFPASGATRTVALTLSDASCPWTAVPADAWAALSAGSESGTGSQTLELAVEANLQSARSTTVAVAGQTLTLDQASGCTFGLPTTSASAAASGGGASFALTASGADCAWTAISGEAWLTGVTASGTGAGTLSYSVAPNSGPARVGTITAGGQTFTVTQASGCTFTIDPLGASVAAAGASGSFTVTASDASCPWAASSTDAFVTNVTAGGVGSGTVLYTVGASARPARTGTIVVPGNTFTLTQASGCTANLSAASVSAPAGGATRTVDLTLSDPGCPWTAAPEDAWITLASGSESGAGSQTLELTVEASTQAARSGRLTVAGQTLTVEQESGCALALPQAAADVLASGGDSSFTVTSGAGCTWTATSPNPWLTNLVATASGVSYTAAPWTGSARSGTITATSTSTLSSVTFTISQASGCAIMLPASTATPGAAGGGAAFEVTAGSGCTWTASPSASWIFNASATVGGVSYQVAANDGPARSATLEVACVQNASSMLFTVNQASGCAVSLPTASAAINGAAGSHAFDVATAAGCSWTAQTSEPWLSEVAVTAEGVSFLAAANTGAARSGIIHVAAVGTASSADYSVNQAGELAAPAITGQPADQTLSEGGTITLSVSATGGSLTYQWRKDGADLGGATSASLSLAGATLADSGDYDVVIENPAGSVTSNPAHVIVLAAAGGDGDRAAPSPEGCGCGASGGAVAPTGLLAALALGLLRRRRAR